MLSCVGTVDLINFAYRNMPKHGAVPLQMQWITSVQTRTTWFSVLTVRLIKGEKAK